MTLLCELKPAIAAAIDSLGGQQTKSVTDLFYLYAAKHINIAIDAFIALRRERRIDGARLLVRPALETMLRLRAVRAHPHLFYRVFFSEVLESDKWFSGIARRHHVPYTAACDRPEWQAFKTRCASEFGTETPVDERLSSYDAAAAIGIETVLRQSLPRLLPGTHGALEAESGNLDERMIRRYSRYVKLCYACLRSTVNIGADCPAMKSFHERFRKVMNQKPDQLHRQKPTGHPTRQKNYSSLGGLALFCLPITRGTEFAQSASFYRTKHNDRVFVPNFPLVDLPAVLFVNRRGCAEAIDIQAFHVSPSGDGCRLLEHGRSDATVAHLRLNKHRGYPW